jgi:hypothetical protein
LRLPLDVLRELNRARVRPDDDDMAEVSTSHPMTDDEQCEAEPACGRGECGDDPEDSQGQGGNDFDSEQNRGGG